MPSDLDVLRRLNREYVEAVARADQAWFDRHLSPDFMNSNPDASLIDRAAFLQQIARGPGVTDLAASDVRVRLLDGFAVIHARTTYTLPDGEGRAGRYTDIWMRRGGRWECVAAHVTRG